MILDVLNFTRRLSENGYFPQFPRQAQILILKILQCILAVKIFAFLDLAKNLSFSDKLLDKQFSILEGKQDLRRKHERYDP